MSLPGTIGHVTSSYISLLINQTYKGYTYILPTVSELRNLFTIIARPRTPRLEELDIYKVGAEISHELALLGQQSNISYLAPNFIIHLNSPEQQGYILSKSPLQTSNFQLDLVAWCKEHELAQLPWITKDTTPHTTIMIEPLTILPAPTKNISYTGILYTNFLKI